MAWKHKAIVSYLLKKYGWRRAYNYLFVIFFIRGEDCGKALLDPLWKLFPRIAPFLWDIEVEVTTKCPLRCIMCEHTYWKDKEYSNWNLTFEQFKSIIDQLPKLKWINLTGEGTPMLNPDFLKMIEYCKQKNIYTVFVHDFFVINEEQMRKIIEIGVERIWASIDAATKETYERIRVGSDFDKVISNIKKFIEFKKKMNSPIPELCFRYTFFKHNYKEMSKFLDLVYSMGGKYVNFVSLLEFEETKDWIYEPPQDLIKELNRKGKKLGIEVLWSHASHMPERKVPSHYCVAWTEPFIMKGGYVLPDCAVLMSNKRQWLEKHAFGNIFEKPLKEIWNSERYKKFRRTIVNRKAPVPLLCVGCRAFNTLDREKRYGIDYEL